MTVSIVPDSLDNGPEPLNRTRPSHAAQVSELTLLKQSTLPVGGGKALATASGTKFLSRTLQTVKF